MTNLRRLVGSANHLVAFEAAARHRNFTHAARELFVSQPAVSRQIKELEKALGASLFERFGTRIDLTSAGREFYASVTQAFAHIERAARALAVRSDASIVRFRISVAASHWILPALGDFYSAHPEIRLHLVCVDELLGIKSKGFDLEVRFGVGGWADALSYPLLDEVIFPVASPGLLSKTPIKSRKDLLRVPLLQLAEFTSPWMDWQRWLPSGSKNTERNPTIRKFTTYAMLLEAATYGHGVALGWKYYVAPALERGELRICLDERRSSRFQEYLVVHRDRANDAAVRRVADWVRVYADETRARFSNY